MKRFPDCFPVLVFPTNNGSWSAYVCNISANTEGSVNEHRMQAPSLIKLYIMGSCNKNYDNLAAQYGQGTWTAISVP